MQWNSRKMSFLSVTGSQMKPTPLLYPTDFYTKMMDVTFEASHSFEYFPNLIE